MQLIPVTLLGAALLMGLPAFGDAPALAASQPAAVRAAEKTPLHSDGVVLGFRSVNEHGMVEFDAVNSGKKKVSLLAPNNSWGDQCYFLLLEDGSKRQVMVPVPMQSYTRNGLSILNLEKGEVKRLRINFGKHLVHQIKNSISVSIVYHVPESVLSDARVNDVKDLLRQIPGEKLLK